MSFTETTTRSWFSRLKSGLAGLVVGPILIIAAIILLFWNEGRAIETYRALAEGASLVVDVPVDAPDSANEGKLVHIAGKVVPGSVAEDPDFAIAADGAVGLNREVEMYQWVQKEESKTEKKLGGSEETVTVYTYAKEWRSGRVNSDEFKKQDGHENPDLPIESQSFSVPDAAIGGFMLSGERLADLGESRQLKLSDDDAGRFADYLGDDYQVERHQGGLYVGANPSSPQVGDVKIGYTRSDLKEASLIGAQKGDTLTPYKTSSGYEIFRKAAGIVPADKMFADAQDENTIISWILRAAGLICMLIGFSLLFSLLGVIADVIPLFGSIVGFGTGLLAMLLTLVLGPLVIAIGWFAYRPLLALAIIAGGVALSAAFWYLRRGKAAPAAATPLGRPQG